MRYLLIGAGLAASLLAGVGYAQCPTPVRPVHKVAAPVYEIPILTQVIPTYVPTPVILIPSYSFQFLPAVQPAMNTQSSFPPPTTPLAAEDYWPVVPGDVVGVPLVFSLFQQKCVRCHAMPSRVGVDLFDPSGVLLTTVDRSRIARVVAEGRMPPQAPLAAHEIALVRQWSVNR